MADPITIGASGLIAIVGGAIGRFLWGVVQGWRAAAAVERATLMPTATLESRISALETAHRQHQEQEATERGELVRRELKAVVREMTTALRRGQKDKE